MKWTDTRKKAKEMGLSMRGAGKEDLIRAIQAREGNFPCFGTAETDCDQVNCCWREDCLSEAKTIVG